LKHEVYLKKKKKLVYVRFGRNSYKFWPK